MEKETEIEKLKKILAEEYQTPYIEEGTKVKINYDALYASTDYKELDPSYRDFLEGLKGQIVTVDYDKISFNNEENPLLVCLKEDTSALKWLIWVGFLDVVS